jgi:hypothetical protein
VTLTFRQTWYAPVFSGLLENRRDGLIILGASALHLGLNLAGLPSWECPILAVTGMPCPGCGLTRATMQLLHGDIVPALRTHVFAPVFLLAFVVMFLSLVLPEKYRQFLLSSVHQLEVRSGFTAFLLSGLMLYWLVRLMGILPFPNIFS